MISRPICYIVTVTNTIEASPPTQDDAISAHTTMVAPRPLPFQYIACMTRAWLLQSQAKGCLTNVLSKGAHC